VQVQAANIVVQEHILKEEAILSANHVKTARCPFGEQLPAAQMAVQRTPSATLPEETQRLACNAHPGKFRGLELHHVLHAI
jgi:hypothetical protein